MQILRIWLPGTRKTQFMFGDKPSIADLSLAYELTQLDGIGFAPVLEEKFPTIHEWMYVQMLSIPEFRKINAVGADKVRYVVKALNQRYAEQDKSKL